MIRRPLPRLVVIAALVLVTGCAGLFATKIRAIKENPGRYDGKAVTVSGTVEESHNLLVVHYYAVNDGSGTISVVTQDALPKEGEKVVVHGKVSQAFKLGTASAVVIVEDPRH
jgi:aspartyl/asparaginyl-tRNA synthetase